MKHFLFGALGLLMLASCAQNAADTESTVQYQKQAEGVWQVSVGTPDEFNLLSELDIQPKLKTINEMGTAELPIRLDDITFEEVDHKTYVRFPLEKGEQIYGLGLNFNTVEKKGRIMRLHVDNFSGGGDNGRNHAPVPFFVSSRGYGALINAARYIDVWCGSSIRKDSKNPPVERDRNTDDQWTSQPYSDNLEFLIPAEGVEIVLFAGPTMMNVVQRFNLYNGGGVLPPKWGLGFWQRVPTKYNDEQVRQEVAEFEKHDFPLSVIGLEPGWQSKSYPCTYEWDETRFPEPEALVSELNQKHIKTNVWINPYISTKGELYQKIEPYTATHTVWCGVVPDYSMPEARSILKDHFIKHQVNLGVSGYKMDENDGWDTWLWPDVAIFPSKHTAEQMRQVYGALMQNLTTQIYKERNQRTYGLVRASNAGTSSFPYVIYNDYYNHRDFITALINSSFIGILWTPEVRTSASAEEWLRRMQTVCFSPLAMLNAWADGTKPWSFPEVEKQVNDVAKLRMQLVPYLYTAFADYAFYGTPTTRAMNLIDGYAAETEVIAGKLDGTANPYAEATRKEVKDQYMVGDNLLIAPLFTGEKERTVILPKGKWYDFYTGNLVGESEIIKIKPGLDKIPVFVKDGGIVPMGPAVTKIDGKKISLEIRHYGEKPGSFNLYDDDGETYNYEKGEFVRIALKVNVDETGKKTGEVLIPEGKQSWSYADFHFKFMTK